MNTNTKKHQYAWRTRRLVGRKMNRSTGAAVVEFAFVAPLMILMTMGMLEVGRMVMVKQLLVNASREGARLAVLPGATAGDVTAHVESELAASSIQGVTVNVSPPTLAASAAGTPVTVTASVEASSVSWVPRPVFSIHTTLTGATTMRKESL